MIGNKLHGMIGLRDRCNHNLRIRLQGKSNICLICQCHKIDDLLSTECSGDRKLSSEGIHEIIHQFRIINSVLDAPIEESHVGVLLSPVLLTSAALLKIHNDEVGAVVAQALDKISVKAPICMLEDFLEKLSAQILEKISYGNLDCLSVLIRRKECRNSFFRKHGPLVLPQLFQVLEDQVANMSKCPASTASKLSAGINTTRESQSQKWSDCSGSTSAPVFAPGRESLRTVEKLFDVIDANCPSAACVVVTTASEDNDVERFHSEQQQQSETQQFLSSQQHESLPIYHQYLKGITLSCMNLLSFHEILQMTLFPTKILNFLGKLQHYPESLRCLFSDKIGMKFCTMIKKLLYTHSTDIKTAALHLVNRMVLTYKSVMEESNADKTFVADLPLAISEVDLIHFITEAMNTSCENLFRAAIQLLDQINSIPQFRTGRMIPVLETTLRISMMRIPDNITASTTYISMNNLILNILTSLDSVPPGIQLQLIYLFERLPKEWTELQYLSWIKSLLFCSEGDLQGNLWSLFVAFVHRSRDVGSCHNVIQLKCVLLIAFAVMKCKRPQEQYSLQVYTQQLLCSPQKEEVTKQQLMHILMDPSFLPKIMALVRYGTSDDSMYISTLLELLQSYPEELLSVRCTRTHFDQQGLETVKVTFGHTTETGLGDILAHEEGNAEYEMEVDPSSTIKVNDVWCWSAKLYMQILAAIRLNPEFITSRQLFDLWNENIARVIAVCYPLYLPQLRNACGSGADSSLQRESSADSSHKVLERPQIKQILEKLDIDALAWAKVIGDYDFASNSSASLETQKHNMILAFYFCFSLFAGKDVAQFFDNGFVERYATFLKTCIDPEDLTQEFNCEIKRIDWTMMSFQFRVALMIASALPLDSEVPIADQIELLVSQVEEACSAFRDDVLVYHCDVFIFLFKHNFHAERVAVVEKWLEDDRDGCISFYCNGNFDELNDDISNSLLEVAAEGNQENSLLAVQLGRKRLRRVNFSFDFYVVTNCIKTLYGKIPFSEDRIDTFLSDEDSLNLLRLSNVIELVIEDDCLFCSVNKFPSGFIRVIVGIMLSFHEVSEIGRRCLKLLTKILRDNDTFQNCNSYLISHKGLINFLGSKLQITSKSNVEESAVAYKLLALLIGHNLEKFSSQSFSYGEPPWIQWELQSLFGYIHNIPKIEILEFLVAMCKINFKCPLIQAVELEKGPNEFGKILLNFVFHLQALSQKVTLRDSKEAVWEILCEMLRLAEDEPEALSHPGFCNDVLFQPWMKVAVTHLLLGCNHVPSKAPLMALEFLKKWTKMMLINNTEGSTKRTPFQHTFLFQSYVELFQAILNDTKTDPSQPNSEKEMSKTTQEKQKQFSSQDSVRLFDIERKAGLISEIADNCAEFLATFT